MKIISTLTTILIFLAMPKISFSQQPNSTINLGILASFEAYTGAGAISNGVGASVSGDVGTHDGIISGFGTSYTDNAYNATAETKQCRFDLLRVYIHLNDLFVDYPGTHAPAFGSSDTITPGVYYTGSAGSLGGEITLDGAGDSNAFFIIKFYGAFTVGAGAEVKLINGTKSSNVFWVADGAISVAANAIMKGTLFSKFGAVGLGAGVVLDGRMLTLKGAITTGVNSVASLPLNDCTIPVFCESSCNPAPAVDVLGVLSDFALFTSAGATGNTSISGVMGNIGTNFGAISGFGDSLVIGSFNNANSLTAQAAIAVDSAYSKLMALSNTVTTHAAAFGSGETVTAGVYYVAAAGSLGGTITLNAQNNSNAIFVFKFAGAFTVGAQSKIILDSGAKRCNVFWIGGAGVSTGAIDIGAGSHLKGTFLSHGGACNSGGSFFLAGRQLSTAGAVNTNTGIIYTTPECVTSISLTLTPLPINLISFTAFNKACNENIIKWTSADDVNFSHCNLEYSNDGNTFSSVAKIKGKAEVNGLNNYSFNHNSKANINFYRLKSIDMNGTFAYSSIAMVTNATCIGSTTIALMPNPTEGLVNIVYENEQPITVKIYQIDGKLLNTIELNPGSKSIDLSAYKSGVYSFVIISNGAIIKTERILKM
jgi:hypothetical protein